MRGITKRYPGVVANDHIDLDVRPGEIHALLGENGAGKTTLMNVLYGLATPDEGEILLDGQAVTIAGPSDAIARGINMVHQHFMLVPVLTVAENILLGEETMANPIFLDRKEARRRIVDLGRRFGFEIDPDAKVGSLSVGWQQRVEILKALYREARILVLDEPTAVLTPQETRGDLRGPAAPRRRGPQHHLHQPQALRGPRDRRPDHRHPPRAGRRRADARPRRTRTTSPSSWSAARSSSRWTAASRTRPTPSSTVEGLRVRDDRGNEVVRGVGPRRPRRRDPRHRRRRRQRPGRARRGAHRPATPDGRHGHARRQ